MGWSMKIGDKVKRLKTTLSRELIEDGIYIIRGVFHQYDGNHVLILEGISDMWEFEGFFELQTIDWFNLNRSVI